LQVGGLLGTPYDLGLAPERPPDQLDELAQGGRLRPAQVVSPIRRGRVARELVHRRRAAVHDVIDPGVVAGRRAVAEELDRVPARDEAGGLVDGGGGALAGGGNGGEHRGGGAGPAQGGGPGGEEDPRPRGGRRGGRGG